MFAKFLIFNLIPLLLTITTTTTTIIAKEYPGGWDGEHSNYGSREKMHQEVEEELHKHDPNASVDKEEETFYYFSLHDYNHDGHLDGHELLSAFYLPDDGSVSLESAEEMIEHVLDEDDRDGDGTISWEEYMASQKDHEDL